MSSWTPTTLTIILLLLGAIWLDLFPNMPRLRLVKEPVASDSDETEEELGEYKYTNLTTSNSIRVLILRPGSRKKVNEIVCELVEKNLDAFKGKYEALSWAWGTDPWDEKIRIRTT